MTDGNRLRMAICPGDEGLGEVVDGLASPEVEAHVASCASCGPRVERLRALGDALRALPLARERATAPLAATLRGMAAAGAVDRSRRFRSIASFAATAAAAALLFFTPAPGGISAALADEAVSHHLRAFATGPACEVESRDPRELAEWLEIGLGSPVHVPAPAGAELVGARRCSLFGEQAGAVIYRSGDRAVTMFVPTPGSRAERSCARAVGECTRARDGQTVCVVEGAGGSPRLLVGELPPEQLCEVAQDS